jgi:hypothetical protein
MSKPKPYVDMKVRYRRDNSRNKYNKGMTIKQCIKCNCRLFNTDVNTELTVLEVIESNCREKDCKFLVKVKPKRGEFYYVNYFWLTPVRP